MLRLKTRWLAARMGVGLSVTILAMLVAASGCSAPSGGPGETWVVERFSLNRGDNQPGTACADGSPLSIYGRRSPSGDWQLHPAFDGHGGLCICSPPLGVHRLVFSFGSATPQAELERVQNEEGIPPYPDVYFWGGDGAGVYLWYATGQFFFVTVPGGDVTRLTAPCFFNSKDLTRQVYVLGSPSPTRDIVVLTKLVGNSDGPAPFHYLLSLLDPSGSERKLLDEFDGVAVGEATNGAVLVALNPGSEPGRWQPSYAEARVYALGQDDTWVRKTVPQATDPHLRGSALTEVARKRGVPWVREEPLAGPAVWLFPVPAEVVGCNGDRLSRWGSSGECLYFLEQGLRVRLETSEASD